MIDGYLILIDNMDTCDQVTKGVGPVLARPKIALLLGDEFSAHLKKIEHALGMWMLCTCKSLCCETLYVSVDMQD